MAPIPFIFKMKKMDNVDGLDADKSEWIKFWLFINPEKPVFKYMQQFAIFQDECPEEWIKVVMAFRKIKKLTPLKELADKTRMFQSLWKGQALSYFEHHLWKGTGINL
jgi:hypothetical protein